MKRLTEIGKRLGTDKADYHEFTEFYDDYFHRVMQSVEKPLILEIGILDGGSLKMYDEFFKGNAKVIGIDSQEKGYLFPYNSNILTLRGDIMNPETIEKCRKAANNQLYDIIIDDGGHTMEQQQRTLWNLWPLLKLGGIFIVEDLHTSGNEDFNPDRTTTTLAVLKELSEGRFATSMYLDEEQLKTLQEQSSSIIICEIPFEQQRTQPPRVSITGLLVKMDSMLPPSTENKQIPATVEPVKKPEPKTMAEIEAALELEKSTTKEPMDNLNHKSDAGRSATSQNGPYTPGD